MPAQPHPDILHRLDTGSLLVLPTARAAGELRRLHDTRQRDSQRSSWELANVQSWQQWTQSLWTSLILNGPETRLLLNSAQEQSLWAEIIRLDETRTGLSSADSLAALARSGLQRAAAYNAVGRLHATATTEDSRTFSAWAEAFTALCRQRNYLSPSLLESALVRAIETGALPTQPPLAFAACHNLTPAQHALLDALGAAGTDIQHLPLAAAIDAPDHTSITLPTQSEELACAARWIRSRLEAAAPGSHAQSIALLVPDLASQQAQIERALRDTLAPELHHIGEDLSSTPWQISAGTALTALPAIADALDLLRWSTGPLPIDRVSALLLSPSLGLAAGRDPSARFDAQTLRRTHRLRPEIDLATVLRLPSKTDPPQWLHHLHTELQRAGDLTRTRTHIAWTELFRSLTRAAHWPGDRDPTATTLALLEAWEGALDTVATLDFSGQRTSFAEALRALVQQLETASLQPPASGAPVQVLTPAAAEGCLFDAIAYLRATDANLPAPAAVHPLLSWPLQRSLAMPGTDPALDAARARRELDALLANTPTALFTSAHEDAAGQLRPSPLLAALPHATPPPPAAAPPVIALGALPDPTRLPALPDTVFGGTRVLKLQAACGFQAFAELRLRASELDQPELGLDALESGDILHRTLQTLWAELQTHSALVALPSSQRLALAARHLDAALARHPGSGAWDLAYLAMHRQRTLDLLLRWLERESERTTFHVVGLEKEEIVPVGPLRLKVRVDRIDTVTLDAATTPPRIGTLLIDYKTGASGTPADWTGDRPDDPQLPLYALLPESGELCGIAFAKLRAGKDMAWLGYQSQPDILPLKKKDPVDIDTVVSDWHETLTRLAEDFAAGRATVDPKLYPRTCERCAQRLLCRLAPETLRATDDTPEDAHG